MLEKNLNINLMKLFIEILKDFSYLQNSLFLYFSNENCKIFEKFQAILLKSKTLSFQERF